MKYSGFYMINAKDTESAKEDTKAMFQKEISNTLNEVYGEHLFVVTDVLRTEEYDEDNGLNSYDVHFILDLPLVNFKEDTKPFHNLEKMICTGLGEAVDMDYSYSQVCLECTHNLSTELNQLVCVHNEDKHREVGDDDSCGNFN